jgi:hypothetical protein
VAELRQKLDLEGKISKENNQEDSGLFNARNKDVVIVKDEKNIYSDRVTEDKTKYVANNEIKGQILVDGASILSVTNGALTADLSGYVTAGDFDILEKAVEDLTADVDAISKKVEKNIVDIGLINDFITNDLNSRIDERLQDTSNEIVNIKTALTNLETNFKAADTTVLTEAKSYTDSKVADAIVTWNMIGS